MEASECCTFPIEYLCFPVNIERFEQQFFGAGEGCGKKQSSTVGGMHAGSLEVCFYRTIHEIVVTGSMSMQVDESGCYPCAIGIYCFGISYFDRRFANFLYNTVFDNYRTIGNGSVRSDDITVKYLDAFHIVLFYAFPVFDFMSPYCKEDEIEETGDEYPISGAYIVMVGQYAVYHR